MSLQDPSHALSGKESAPNPSGTDRATGGLHSRRPLRTGFFAALLMLVVGLRIAAVFSESINWDELNLVHNAAWTHQSGELHAGGRPGLAVLILLPLVADCEDEVAVVRRARLLWVVFSLALVAGLAVLMIALNPSSPSAQTPNPFL